MHHGGPGGPPLPPGLEDIPVKLFFKKVLGGTGLPKDLLGTIQSNPLAQLPQKTHGEPISPQIHVFQAPFLAEKKNEQINSLDVATEVCR